MKILLITLLIVNLFLCWFIAFNLHKPQYTPSIDDLEQKRYVLFQACTDYINNNKELGDYRN